MTLFLPIFGESRSTKNNISALSDLTIAARAIDLITSNGDFIHPNVHIKNALKQPSSFQFVALKKLFKVAFMDTFRQADYRKLCDTCAFNIYGHIVYKTKSGCSYFYCLLSYKKNTTMLWEESSLS